MPIIIGPQFELFLAIVVPRTSYTAGISVELAKRKIRRLDSDLDVVGALYIRHEALPNRGKRGEKKLARIFI